MHALQRIKSKVAPWRGCGGQIGLSEAVGVKLPSKWHGEASPAKEKIIPGGRNK